MQKRIKISFCLTSLLTCMILVLPFVAKADLQSDFYERMQKIYPKKSSSEKIKASLKAIEKKTGSAIVKSENFSANPYQMSVDSEKIFSFVNQLIYVQLKNDFLCRGQLETFQNQEMFQGLRVICIDPKGKIQTFEETI